MAAMTGNAIREALEPCLTLAALQRAHVERQEEWCPDQKPDLSFRGNEMAGEVGEACNVIKKLERERHGWRGSRATTDDLGDELADVVHTAVLCAITAGIELEPRVVAKFNATSEKNGLATRLPDSPTYGLGLRALEWGGDHADTSIGRYAIRRTTDGYEVSVDGEEIAHLGYDAPRAQPSARDAARDYAQADFERRVLSCLSTHTAAGAGPVGEAVAWLCIASDGGRHLLFADGGVPTGWASATALAPAEEPGEVERFDFDAHSLKVDLARETKRAETAEAALAETRERLEKVEAALRALEKAASDVAPYRVKAGSKWSRLTTTILAARTTLGDAQEAGK